MSDRETVDFKTKDGSHSAKIVTFLTRRERRAIKNALFGEKEISVGGSGDTNVSMNMAATDLAEDKTIELAVLELDGSSETILERYLELPDDAAAEIKAKIDKQTGSVETEKKDIGAVNTKS